VPTLPYIEPEVDGYTMPTATNDGVAIHYEVDDPADGERPPGSRSSPERSSDGAEPVVLLEGLGYGRWMWRWLRERLADEYRVLVPDNRGTGDSDAPEGPYTMAEMAADVEAVLADAGIDRAHLVGASMGGMTAQQYALAFDRAATLSLLCTSHGGEEAVPMPEETAAVIFEVPDGVDERETVRRRMAPAVSDGFYDWDPELVERIVDWRLEQDATEAGRDAQAAAVQAFDASDRVGEIDVPALVLHGDADRVVPVENGRTLHETLPDGELVVVDGGPHLFFLEEPDRIADRIRAFLASHPLEEVPGQ